MRCSAIVVITSLVGCQAGELTGDYRGDLYEETDEETDETTTGEGTTTGEETTTDEEDSDAAVMRLTQIDDEVFGTLSCGTLCQTGDVIGRMLSNGTIELIAVRPGGLLTPRRVMDLTGTFDGEIFSGDYVCAVVDDDSTCPEGEAGTFILEAYTPTLPF